MERAGLSDQVSSLPNEQIIKIIIKILSTVGINIV